VQPHGAVHVYLVRKGRLELASAMDGLASIGEREGRSTSTKPIKTSILSGRKRRAASAAAVREIQANVPAGR